MATQARPRLRAHEPRETRVLAIWTRDENASASTGRGRITREIRAVIERDFPHAHHRLHHAPSLGPVRGLAAGVAELGRGALAGDRLPLQCTIYLPRAQTPAVLAAVLAFAPDVVYLDSIRAAPLAPALRAAFPHLRIVLDMDDLMSRRWAFFNKSGIQPGFGFIERYLPAALTGSGAVQAATGRLLRSESRRLLRLETRSTRHVDDVVLISDHEAALFSRLARRAGPVAARVVGIRPPVEVGPRRPWQPGPALRFVFIGTDELPQNRRTIEAILELWARLRPATPVHLYGNLERRYRAVAGVHLEGFAPSLDEVYGPGSILLAPSYVTGGVKTKVLEAFAFGCPVIGNRSTFEGIHPLDVYPLLLTEGGIERAVMAPQAMLAALERAARIGRDLVERHYARPLFQARWRALLDGRPIPTDAAAAAGPPVRLDAPTA